MFYGLFCRSRLFRRRRFRLPKAKRNAACRYAGAVESFAAKNRRGSKCGIPHVSGIREVDGDLDFLAGGAIQGVYLTFFSFDWLMGDVIK